MIGRKKRKTEKGLKGNKKDKWLKGNMIENGRQRKGWKEIRKTKD
jgi:hypothetical protein